MEEYMREKSVIIHSSRLLDELYTFIWKVSRPEAMHGYNDDLVMAFSIALWVRDTALRLRQQGIELTKNALDGISHRTTAYGFGGNSHNEQNPWEMDVNGESEDLKWLL